MSEKSETKFRSLPVLVVTLMLIVSMTVLGVLCAKASLIEKEASDENRAVMLAASLVDMFYAADSPAAWENSILSDEWKNGMEGFEDLKIRENLQEEKTDAGSLWTLDLSILSGKGTELYSLRAIGYVPESAEETVR